MPHPFQLLLILHPLSVLSSAGAFLETPATQVCVRALKIVRLSLYPFKNLSLGFILLYFRNVLSTSCTTIPLLESPTRETFSSIQRADAADRILSLTTMNAVVPCPSSQPFTLGGFIIFTVIISSKVIVKTSHEAQSALNSG